MTRVCVVYVRLTGIKITAIIANCVLYLFVCVCAWPFTFLCEPHLNRINGLQQNIISHKGPMAFCECNSWITVLDNWPNGKKQRAQKKTRNKSFGYVLKSLSTKYNGSFNLHKVLFAALKNRAIVNCIANSTLFDWQLVHKMFLYRIHAYRVISLLI